MKNVSSWFCFRPVSAVEEPEDSRRRRVDGMVDGSKVLKSEYSSLSDTVCYKISDESTRPRVALMRSLSRMIIRTGRRVREDDEPSQHGFSRKIGRTFSRRIGGSFSGKTAPYFDVESKSMRRAKSWRLEAAHGTVVESSSSLLPFSSSSSSSSSSMPLMTAAACGRPNPSPVGSGRSEVGCLDPKHARVRGVERPAVVVGWWVQACAFVMILCVTVFWGRLFAILLTSTCLYVLPHRSAGGSRRRDPARLPAEIKSDNKRVIMEGLLQRNNRQTVRTGH